MYRSREAAKTLTDGLLLIWIWVIEDIRPVMIEVITLLPSLMYKKIKTLF